MSQLKVLTVVQPQTGDDAATSALTTFGELMETLDGVLGESQLLQVTSQPGS